MSARQPLVEYCLYPRGCVFFSSTGVTIDRRRDHNQFLIKQNQQPTYADSVASHIEHIPSRLRVTVEVLLLIIAVSLPFTVRAGFFSGLFTEEIIVEVVDEAANDESPTDISLLTAGLNANPQGARGGAEIQVDDNALVSTGPVPIILVKFGSIQCAKVTHSLRLLKCLVSPPTLLCGPTT